ncbi:MAG: ParA family protein [Phycisphaerales bacterium]|nr:ParA family protein [Phycisphaerales bacterium]MDP6693352.1 ParA family protein [Phycisphaerales bacterium]
MSPRERIFTVRTIAIVNQKGGCGKTTTAINVAAVFASRGLRTLLVDMDPQSHCAAGLGVPEEQINESIGDALLARHDESLDSEEFLWEVTRHLHLAPSTMMLSAIEAAGGGLHAMPDKDRRLESLLHHLNSSFDRCVIDCPPNIGLLTYNALRAATEAIVPVETGYFSLRGARRQRRTIEALIAHIGKPIECRILPSIHRPSPLARKLLQRLRESFGEEVAPVVIRDHETLREAASFGQPVIEFSPGCDAEKDFVALVDWLEDIYTPAAPLVEVHPVGNGRAAELARRVASFKTSPHSPEIAGRITPTEVTDGREL